MPQISKFFLFLLLIFIPMGAVQAVTGTSYIIDPEADIFSSAHKVSGSTYTISGSVDRASGRATSSSYILESGTVTDGACGDGFTDPSESCDGADVGSATCVTQGFSSGTLACSSSCAYDTSSCTSGGGGGGGGAAQTVTTTAADEAPASPEVSSTLEEQMTEEEELVSYDDTVILYGSREEDTTIEINGSEEGVTYPTDTSWKAEVSVAEGDNEIEIVAVKDGEESEPTVVTVNVRTVGDANEDGEVDDYDLSLLVAAWDTDNPELDFNEDGVVDDYDFSLLVSRWAV